MVADPGRRQVYGAAAPVGALVILPRRQHHVTCRRGCGDDEHVLLVVPAGREHEELAAHFVVDAWQQIVAGRDNEERVLILVDSGSQRLRDYVDVVMSTDVEDEHATQAGAPNVLANRRLDAPERQQHRLGR